MSVREATNPEIIELGRQLGFKGKILIDDSQPGIFQFITNNCFHCDNSWTVQVFGHRTEEELQDPNVSDEHLGPFYLCDEHYERAKEKWVRPVRIAYRRNLGGKVK